MKRGLWIRFEITCRSNEFVVRKLNCRVRGVLSSANENGTRFFEPVQVEDATRNPRKT